MAGVSRRNEFDVLIPLVVADYFNKRLCVASRDISRSRNMNDLSDGLGSGCANCNFIPQPNFMSRLCHAAIEQDKARVTELLSYGAARAEAAEF